MRLIRLLICGMLVLTVAACGSRPGIRDELTATNAVFAQVQAQIRKSRGGPFPDTSAVTAGTPDQVRQVMATLAPGALNSVVVLKTNESAILQDGGFNHGYRRWVSPTGQTFTLKQGMLTSTRGMGFDLMSVEADEAIAIFQRGAEGNVNKIYRFLDGEDQIVEAVAQCTISPRGSETVTTVAGVTRSARKMRETCLIGRQTLNNYFWIAGGQVIQSQQWASDEIGDLYFQALRG